jgi:hypothetical protein
MQRPVAHPELLITMVAQRAPDARTGAFNRIACARCPSTTS